MGRHIKHCRSEREYYFKEGCHIIEISNSPDDEIISIARARVEAGGTTRWHWLDGTFERYFITSGRAMVEVGVEPPAPVTVGDVVLIPPRTWQRIHNSGKYDLEFLAICSPPFNYENYHDIEESCIPD
ncbi:MAG: cupin domain-containing protein [Gammaproteobacteria bacterium]|nr:cupin domain-containing protein [Gammaproteobacteria bacterium]MCY4357825.1 cupin domain-containing protein [Gammaproteobacteria bacterium]